MTRHILVYSQHARTSGTIHDLMRAGRIDIILHSMLHTFFTSNAIRTDTILHLILDGPPTPPRHITIHGAENVSWSKKDLLKILQIALYKARPGETREALPGVRVAAEGFITVVESLSQQMRAVLLDPRGTPFKDLIPPIEEDILIILGDHEGIPGRLRRRVREQTVLASLGNVIYYTSQSIIISHYLLDTVWGAKLTPSTREA